MTAPAPDVLPTPLVRFRSDPARWIYNRAVLAADAVVLAHIGLLIVAAIYFLTTQTNPTVKLWWDTTVTPSALRHDIRDVGEGVLASCMAQAVVWNPFTRSHRRTGRLLRRVQARFRIPVGVASLVGAAAIGTIAFVVGEGVLHLLGVHSTPSPVAGSLWHRITTVWKSNWDKKALGFVAAIAARRPLHVLFDQAQEYFASRRASSEKGVSWYHPPVFKARYNYLTEHRREVGPTPPALRWVAPAVVAIAVGLAGFGFYVLTYVK